MKVKLDYIKILGSYNFTSVPWYESIRSLEIQNGYIELQRVSGVYKTKYKGYIIAERWIKEWLE